MSSSIGNMPLPTPPSGVGAPKVPQDELEFKEASRPAALLAANISHQSHATFPTAGSTASAMTAPLDSKELSKLHHANADTIPSASSSRTPSQQPHVESQDASTDFLYGDGTARSAIIHTNAVVPELLVNLGFDKETVLLSLQLKSSLGTPLDSAREKSLGLKAFDDSERTMTEATHADGFRTLCARSILPNGTRYSGVDGSKSVSNSQIKANLNELMTAVVHNGGRPLNARCPTFNILKSLLSINPATHVDQMDAVTNPVEFLTHPSDPDTFQAFQKFAIGAFAGLEHSSHGPIREFSSALLNDIEDSSAPMAKFVPLYRKACGKL